MKSQEGGDMQAAIREHYSQTAIQSTIGPGATLAQEWSFVIADPSHPCVTGQRYFMP